MKRPLSLGSYRDLLLCSPENLSKTKIHHRKEEKILEFNSFTLRNLDSAFINDWRDDLPPLLDNTETTAHFNRQFLNFISELHYRELLKFYFIP